VAERSVDPRTLMSALFKAAKHRGIDISSGSEARKVKIENGCVKGVQTQKTFYSSAFVVNCAGAWAGEIAPHSFPVKPVKGQMLAVVGGPKLTHVIRSPDVYLVPRSDGRAIIGSTLEEAGFDKQVNVDTIERLFHSATKLVPGLSQARQHEAWAGLRPGTPDNLPLLGPTSTPGYFISSGHYRDGILLAPATAKVLTEAIMGAAPAALVPFSPNRFS
jgi:glycine oxidase